MAGVEWIINNSYYQIDYTSSGITSIGLESGDAASFAIEWGFYRSSEGGCSGGVDNNGKVQLRLYGCDSLRRLYVQAKLLNCVPCGNSTPSLTVAHGPLVTRCSSIAAGARTLCGYERETLSWKSSGPLVQYLSTKLDSQATHATTTNSVRVRWASLVN